MFRVAFHGQSWIDGVEFPLRVVFDLDDEHDLAKKVESVVANWLEEMDTSVRGVHLLGQLTVEVIALCQVQ